MNFEKKFILENGEAFNKEFPDTFDIPELKKRENIKNGELVKLSFTMEKGNTKETVNERMWVKVVSVESNYYIGKLDNIPFEDVSLNLHDTIYFQAKHIIATWEEIKPTIHESDRDKEFYNKIDCIF